MVTLNNIESASSLVCLTDVPNLIKVEDYDAGTKASIVFNFVGDLASATTADSQWYINVFGENITNVLNPSNAYNKSFYVSTSTASTAASVMRALRNCPIIAANFTVVASGASLTITSREIGSIGDASEFVKTNITAQYMTYTSTDGTSSSSLHNALIDVDILDGNGNYITTLEKNFYNGECTFDVSPVLTTMAQYDVATPYTFKVSSYKDGEYNLIETSEENYIINGYMCNQGEKYIEIPSGGLVLAQNVSRGTAKGTYNNSILYIYENTLPMSFYAGSNMGGMTIYVDYLDSALNVLNRYTTTWRNTSSNKLKQVAFDMQEPFFSQSTYVDVTLGTTKIRYTVIHPFKATEHITRTYWHNSYGGVSFFDWTGERSENHTSDITTYEKNIFDYYTSDVEELEKVYSNEIKYDVTLKSHLMEKDGVYIFNDLLQAKDVWTEVNGKTYKIIVDSIVIEEQNQNDIFLATIKYHYSLPTTIG